MRRSLFLLVALLLSFPSPGADRALPVSRQEEDKDKHCPPVKFKFVETLQVPSDGTVVSTSFATSPDVLYLIVASGTYKWGNCDPVNCPNAAACNFDRFGDAEYLTDDCWQTVFNEYLGFDVSLFVNGGNVDWGAFSEDHVYYFVLRGTGEPFTFHINDCPRCYVDNEGSLEVTLYAAHKRTADACARQEQQPRR